MLCSWRRAGVSPNDAAATLGADKLAAARISAVRVVRDA
jgi:hypothetical protein